MKMKKIHVFGIFLAALLAALPPFVPLCHADDLQVKRCVTWITKQNSWEAEYYQTGSIPVPPEGIPTVEDEYYLYSFAGWQKLTSPEEVNAYNEEPGLRFNESFVPASFEPIQNDTVYAARYYKSPKKFAVNEDKLIDSQDISILLDHLSGKAENVGPGADADNDGISTIMDVSKLLYYLLTGEE